MTRSRNEEHGPEAMSILVTGVSSGLGHAMAAHLLDRGDAVLGLSCSEPADLVAALQDLRLARRSGRPVGLIANPA